MDIEHLLNADYVVYRSNSVCRVEGIEERAVTNTLEKKNYLVLIPINKRESKIYVPADNELLMGKIRKALTKDEIDVVLDSCKGQTISWIDDRKQRNEYFRNVLGAGDHKELLLMIRCLLTRKKHLAIIHRKLSGQDDTALQSAIKMISEEFAFSLGITKDEVTDYIRRALN